MNIGGVRMKFLIMLDFNLLLYELMEKSISILQTQNNGKYMCMIKIILR